MFSTAGLSFAFGAWQYLYARTVQANSSSRVAAIVGTIQHSDLATAKKQALYAQIFENLPAAPKMLAFDFSGSFASQQLPDACTNDGQRSVCQALLSSGADTATVKAVCGNCKP
jgi:uncharacterized membrane protein YjjP (DUF1212 family)